MGKDTKFRAGVAERIGLGFELLRIETIESVSSAPSSQEMDCFESKKSVSVAPRARFELATLRLTALRQKITSRCPVVA